MATPSMLVPLRTLFAVLGLVMAATLVYTIVSDGSPFRRELLTPWMNATLVDFYVNVVALAVWVAYKESTWISALLWTILLVCFGSFTTCAYIVKNLCEISSQGFGYDPACTLLLRNGGEQKLNSNFLLLGKILFSVLGVLVSAVVICTIATDGLPFRMELLTPWMAATLIDFYINVIAISVWIAYREPSWLSTFIWIVLLICFGSIATCAYIVIQLGRISSQDTMYHVLLAPPSNHAITMSEK